MILNLQDAPEDALERIIWLDGVEAAVRRELDLAYAESYFSARLEGRFDHAVQVGRTSRKRALKMTRQENVRTGRSVRWNDGLDPSSTLYVG